MCIRDRPLAQQLLASSSQRRWTQQRLKTVSYTHLDVYKRQVDDDMKLEALKDTNYIKTIVTLEDKMDLERKSKQSVQGNLYVRFLCFGNGSLSALHDRSYGFYRRQIILTVKDVPPDRVDDPLSLIHIYSDYVGGMKETTLKEMLAKKPEKVIELAVKGMLPKGPLGRAMNKKLFVYAGPEHKHEAQKPEVLTF